MQYLNENATNIFKALIALHKGDKDYKLDNSSYKYKPVYISLAYDSEQNNEEVSYKIYSISHLIEKNGDTLTCPTVSFYLSENGEVAPLEYNYSNGKYYLTAEFQYDKGLVIFDEREHRALVDFANLWLNDINQQQGILV